MVALAARPDHILIGASGGVVRQLRLGNRPWMYAVLVLLPALTSCTGPGSASEQGDAGAPSEANYLATVAEDWADYYGITDPPNVGVTRYVLPEEQQQAQDDCLSSMGFQVDGPGMLYYPAEQEDAATVAQYTCRMQYPVMQHYAQQQWGPDQTYIQYDWTVEYVIPCLEGWGHRISDVPSRDVFVAGWDTEPFFPFAQVQLEASADDFNAEWARLEATCSQIAPSPVLWDGVSIEQWRASN